MNIGVIVIIVFSIATVVILALCTLYLVFVYRRLLERYNNFLLRENKSQIRRKIQDDASKFVDTKIDNAIKKATETAVDVISKKAKGVVDSMKRNAFKELVKDEEAQEAAVTASFDEARADVEAYKASKLEEVRVKANEILEKVTRESLGEVLDKKEQDQVVMKALENAKRANIF